MTEKNKITGLIPFLLTTGYDLSNAQFNWRSIILKSSLYQARRTKFLAGFSQISLSIIILKGFYRFS